MSNQGRPEVARTRAEVRRSWWPGWIWAIPIAALLLVGWWAVRTLMSGGKEATISFADVHGLKEGNTTVVYRGMTVGKVKGVKLSKKGDAVEVTAHIEDDAAQFLTSGTQFWLRGANPSFSNPSSLSTILSGPTIVMEPGPGKPTSHFVGLTHKPVVSGAHGRPQLYTVALKGSVGELKPGEPVKLRGFTVGEVKDVGFRYDARTGELATPVTLALYPSLFHIDGATSDQAALATVIGRLVEKGLRARLERDPPLVGSPQVSLTIVPGAPAAKPAVVDGIPEIPTAPDSGLDSIVQRVNKVPIEAIAQNVLEVTHHLDTLVSSPKLDDAIAQLDATLQQLHETADTAAPKITDLVDRLRKTASQLDDAAKAAQDTAKAADKVLGGTPSQNDMQEAMRQVSNAARSVRELANYLDRHPEALVRGRAGE